MSSRSLGTLTIDLVAKTGGFEQGMDRAARAADKRMREMQRTAKMFGVAIGATIGGVMAAGVATFVRNSIEAEKQLAQLDAILKSTGNAAGYTRDQLVAMAREFQNKSTFGANEIIEAETRMLSYSGVVGENIPRAMQAVIDQSTRLGMSLSQSAETIGRALESPAKAAAALAQQGFGAAFTKEVRATIDALVNAGREADAQILILEILEESYGGAAEAARDTFGGALQALRHSINDVMTGDDGSLDGLTQAINELIVTLNSPEFRRGTSAMTQAFVNFTNDAANSIDPLMRELRGLGSILEGMGMQAEAAGMKIKAALTLDSAGFERSLELMERGAALMDQGLRGALGGHTPNPFRNVRSGVSSTYDNPATVDTTGLVLEPEKKAKAARTEAEKLRDTYGSLMDSMKERIALMGVESETARMVYRTQEGDLKGLDDALKANLVTMAEQEEGHRMLREAIEEEDRSRTLADEKRKEGLEHGRSLVADLRFEIELMKMGNAERATAIQLYGMSAEAVQKYGEAIRKANEDIEAQMNQARFMDDMRSSFAGFFEDVATGTKSVSDAFRDMLSDISRMIVRAAAEKWIEQLFGAQGTTQTGAAGGWMAALASMFGGGKASGGAIQAGKVYEVNERGIEMATVNGRDYMLAGGNGRVTPAHQIQRGGSGGAANVKLEVINNGPPVQATAQRSSGPDGSEIIKLVLSAVADDMASGGRTAQAARGRFGLKEAI